MTFEGWSWLPWALLAAMIMFGLGWLAARTDIKQLLNESRALPQSYFRGLNFLLNEQPDKAIEAFIEVTKANPETVELQFALGSLFCKRGEVDRAIRIHQSLSERSDISAEQRTTALLELANDYQKAGLLDHARQILNDLAAKLIGTESQQLQTLRLLLDIGIQEKNWRLAIETATRLEAGSKQSYRGQIANYYCELAETDFTSDHKEQAFACLDKALAANAKCIRANLIRGNNLAKAGKHAEAIQAWRTIEQQNPDYLGLTADAMLQSYEAIGKRSEGLSLLREWQQHYPALDLLNTIFKATMSSEGADAAYKLVRDDLMHNPTLIGIDHLIEARMQNASAEQLEDLKLVKAVVHSHSSKLASYMCASCGFKAKQFYWQCPACAAWESFAPRRTAEFDSADRHLARMHLEG